MLRPQGKTGAKRPADLHYPAQAQVEYVIKRGSQTVRTGCGQAITLSSNEVTIDSAAPLASGMDIELIVPWPAPAGTVDGLMLRIKGRTVRSQGNRATVLIAEYDFEMRPEPKAVQTSEQRASGAKSSKLQANAPLRQIAPLAS
jgi:hypothetical protein